MLGSCLRTGMVLALSLLLIGSVAGVSAAPASGQSLDSSAKTTSAGAYAVGGGDTAGGAAATDNSSIQISVNDSATGKDTTQINISVQSGVEVPAELSGDVTSAQYAAVLGGDETLSARSLAAAINAWSADGTVDGVDIGAFELSKLINYWADS